MASPVRAVLSNLETVAVSWKYALPRAPFEPSFIGFVSSSAPESWELGRLLAPPAPQLPADVVPYEPPRYARWESFVPFDLVLQNYRFSTDAELHAALYTLASNVCVEALLVSNGGDCAMLLSLETSVEVNLRRRCVVITVALPSKPSTPGNWGVSLRHVAIGGAQIQRAPSFDLDVIPVIRGMAAPLKLAWTERPPYSFNTLTAPAITTSGTMYLPLHDSETVHVFSRDGGRMPSIPCSRLGLSRYASVAAYDAASRTVFFADWIGASTALVAVDADSAMKRWASNPGALDRCRGIAVLEGPRLVVASNHERRRLCIFRITDGEQVGEVSCDHIVGRPECLAAVPGSARLFASIGGSVQLLEWVGHTLKFIRSVTPVGPAASVDRPLAVLPTSGNGTGSAWCLVVGTYGSPLLEIYAIADGFESDSESVSLLCSHALAEGSSVKGLAADPSGQALVVCVSIARTDPGYVNVLPWPLPVGDVHGSCCSGDDPASVRPLPATR
jgi:hypothetical protein